MLKKRTGYILVTVIFVEFIAIALLIFSLTLLIRPTIFPNYETNEISALPVDATSEAIARYLGDNQFAYNEMEQFYEANFMELNRDARARYAFDQNTSESELLLLGEEVRRDTLEWIGFSHQTAIDNLESTSFQVSENYDLKYVVFENASGLTIQILISTPTTLAPSYPVMIMPNGSESSPYKLFGLNGTDYHNAAAKSFASDYIVAAVYLIDDKANHYYLSNAIGINHNAYQICDKISSTLDYIETIPGADLSKIGIYGISLGGKASIVGSLCDNRIDVTAASGTNVFTSNATMLLSHRRFWYPAAYDHNVINIPDLYEMMYGLYPRPVIMELNLQDSTGVIPEAEYNAGLVQDFYSQLGQPEDVDLIKIADDSDHCDWHNHHCMEISQVKTAFDKHFNVR